jgi:hypothetical protein
VFSVKCLVGRTLRHGFTPFFAEAATQGRLIDTDFLDADCADSAGFFATDFTDYTDY